MLNIFYYQLQGMNDRLIINRQYRPPKEMFFAHYYNMGFMVAHQSRQLEYAFNFRAIWDSLINQLKGVLQ